MQDIEHVSKRRDTHFTAARRRNVKAVWALQDKISIGKVQVAQGGKERISTLPDTYYDQLPAQAVAPSEEPRHHAVTRYLGGFACAARWGRTRPCPHRCGMLLARIYEALPLSCPICHSQMRIIAFINDAGIVKKILDHIGESTQPPRIAPARGPPLWDPSAQPAPEVEFDQRIAW